MRLLVVYKFELFCLIQIIILLSIYSCQQDDDIPTSPINPTPPDTTEVNVDTTMAEVMDTSCVPTFDIPIGNDDFWFDPWKGNQENGWVVANRDSMEWEGSAYAVKGIRNNQCGIGIKTFLNEGSIIPIEFILIETTYSVGCFPFVVEDHFTDTTKHITYRIIDGDMPLEDYCISGDDNDNFLEITTLDTVDNIIEGRFMATFYRDTIGEEPDYIPLSSREVRFANGEFSCQFVN